MTAESAFLVISDELVRGALTPADCVAAVEAGFRLYASGAAESAYMRLPYGDGHASLHVYSAYMTNVGTSTKILSADASRTGAYIRAVIVMTDSRTGEVEALLDARYLTAMRTAAASALSIRYVARKESAVLGILGTGLQARTHLLCSLAVHPFSRVVVWGRDDAHVGSFIKEMESRAGVPITRAPTADTACLTSDVITCTTAARLPLFRATSVRPGSHVITIAPLTGIESEVPLELVKAGWLVVDDRRKFSDHWTADGVPSVAAELGNLILGGQRVGRSDTITTVFHSVGLAFEDLVSARVVLDQVTAGTQSVRWTS